MSRAARIAIPLCIVVVGGVAAYALLGAGSRGLALLLLELVAVTLGVSLVLFRRRRGAEAPTRRQLRQRLPWLTHGIAAVVAFLVLLLPATTRYGIAPTGTADPVDPGTVVVLALWTLGMTLPMAWFEVMVVSFRVARWVARGTACVVALFLAGFSLFPVTFRIYPDDGPIQPTEILTSLVACAVVLAGYALVLLAGTMLAGVRHAEAVPLIAHQSA